LKFQLDDARSSYEVHRSADDIEMPAARPHPGTLKSHIGTPMTDVSF